MSHSERERESEREGEIERKIIQNRRARKPVWLERFGVSNRERGRSRLTKRCFFLIRVFFNVRDGIFVERPIKTSSRPARAVVWPNPSTVSRRIMRAEHDSNDGPVYATTLHERNSVETSRAQRVYSVLPSKDVVVPGSPRSFMNGQTPRAWTGPLSRLPRPELALET